MRTPTLFVSFTAAILLFPLGAFAEDSVALRIKRITVGHEKKVSAFSKELQSLPREAQSKFYRSNYPSATEAIAAIKAIVLENPRDPAVVEAVRWVVKYARGSASGDAEDTLLGVLVQYHLNDGRLVDVAVSLGEVDSEVSRRFLKTLMEKSAVRDVRGMALYSYAATIQRDEARTDEYVLLTERLIKEYPDLKVRGRNLAEAVKSRLFAAKHLAIGKTAPEIIGKDVDGKEMKLSDYRGKVVVIDFWGDW